MSSFRSVAAGCGMETKPVGQWASFNKIPSSVVPKIPSKIAALIFRAIKTNVSTRPKQAI